MTDEEINKLAHEIGSDIYEYANTIIQKSCYAKNAKISDFINVVVIAMTSVDVSVLVQIKKAFSEARGSEIDFAKLMDTYIINLEAQLPPELLKLYKRMN